MKPKLFDEQQVLEKVIELFWQHGFEGTSMQMLQNTTGLSRASIYHSFESKNALFRRALGQYLSNLGKIYAGCLNSSENLPEALYCLLNYISDPNRFPRSCLLVLSTLELAQHEEQTQMMIQRAHAAMQQAVVERLKKAQINEPDNIAQMLCIQIYGLLVLHKTAMPLQENALERIVQSLIVQ